MKKMIKSLMLIVVAIIAFTSCEKETSITPNNITDSIPVIDSIPVDTLQIVDTITKFDGGIVHIRILKMVESDTISIRDISLENDILGDEDDICYYLILYKDNKPYIVYDYIFNEVTDGYENIYESSYFVNAIYKINWMEFDDFNRYQLENGNDEIIVTEELLNTF